MEKVHLQPGEYIHIDIPRWYWITMITPAAVGMVCFAVSVIATIIFGLPWVTYDGGEATLFLIGSTIYFFSGLWGGILIIIAVYTFPKSIRAYPRKK